MDKLLVRGPDGGHRIDCLCFRGVIDIVDIIVERDMSLVLL
jgi:hypothetical protein